MVEAAEISESSEECTSEPTPYPFPDFKNVKIWDLPGANTARFPLKSYAADKSEFFSLLANKLLLKIF